RIDIDDAERHLAEDHVDFVIGGLLATIARAEANQLSDTYLEAHPAFVVPEHRADEVQRMDQIQGRDDFVVGIADRTLFEGLERMQVRLRLTDLDTAASFFEAERPPADALFLPAEEGYAWTLVYPGFRVVFPKGLPRAVPIACALPRGEPSFERFLNHFLELRRLDGTIERLYDHWILGKVERERRPRWSVIRDVLDWID
ncbi:MAG: substrate-binding periplasmic protein, partial [Planctomycetota bacterium]